ncbi:hypothetical protein BGZ73_003145 [Actinomortierella ambigua]|nr:hypothetical protein BGZ73_003145 [Actinomortierella ambigua]
MSLDDALLSKLPLRLESDPDATLTTSSQPEQRARYLYDNASDDWGSSVSEDDGDDDHDGGEGDEDGELLGTHHNRIGRSSSSSATAAGPSIPQYPERETGAKTGPKGVLADQQYHRQKQDEERAQQLAAYQAKMQGKAMITTSYREDFERERQAAIARGEAPPKDAALQQDEDEDEKELARIRQNRLKQYQSGTSRPVLAPGRKIFGTLMEMNGAQYVTAIDDEHKDTTVIIHIYAEANPECRRLDDCLILLAARYATTKFIRINAKEVDFDPQVCPTVLAYRAGELVGNMVKISYDLKDDFDDLELEELFTKERVLTPHDRYERDTFKVFGSTGLDGQPSGSPLGGGSSSDDFDPFSLARLQIGSGSRRGILSGFNTHSIHYDDFDR